MKVTKKMTIEKEVVDDVLCDKCGKSTTVYAAAYSPPHGFFPISTNTAEFSYNPGYGSSFDGCRIKLDLCEECFFEIYETITGVNPDPEEENMTKKYKGFEYDGFYGV